MLKEIKLTLADRHVINQLITGAKEARLDTARKCRDVRRDLALRGATKAIDARIEKLSEKKKVLTVDDIIEWGDEPQTYTTNEANLTWLRGLLIDRDWSKVLGQGGEEVWMGVNAALLEAVAHLADAIESALAKGEAKGE